MEKLTAKVSDEDFINKIIKTAVKNLEQNRNIKGLPVALVNHPNWNKNSLRPGLREHKFFTNGKVNWILHPIRLDMHLPPMH
ncbi:hypothetical protein [Oceanobacillus limi]|uniref:hypothetical protein n=1 Tax=Oceanobacillus limi TaxID=930131 RepID=UPI000B8561B7|nr:hypothetical protein [Oceanobacillus limi]